MIALALTALLAQSPQRVSFIFGGDVIPHDPVKFVAKLRTTDGNHGGWEHVFGALQPHFRSHDIAVVNLETPIVTVKRPEYGEMVFSAGPDLPQGLRAVGVTVASFANNHGLDQHREGIVSTRAYVADAGLLIVGSAETEAAAWEPLIIERSGLRIGLFSFTRFLNGFHNSPDAGAPHVPLVHYASDVESGGYNEEQLLEKVKAARAKVDALIVIPHWGDEYSTKPKHDDRKLAQAIVDLGVVAIVGHHPHVVQPMERFSSGDGGTSLVAFSLGNLVSNQDYDDASGLKRDGLLVRFVLERAGPNVPVVVRDVGVVALSTENRTGGPKVRNVQVVELTSEVTAVEERIEALKTRADPSERMELKRLQKKLAALRLRTTRLDALTRGALDAGS